MKEFRSTAMWSVDDNYIIFYFLWFIDIINPNWIIPGNLAKQKDLALELSQLQAWIMHGCNIWICLFIIRVHIHIPSIHIHIYTYVYMHINLMYVFIYILWCLYTCVPCENNTLYTSCQMKDRHQWPPGWRRMRRGRFHTRLTSSLKRNGGFLNGGTSKLMVDFIENHTKMDDLGVSPF